MSDLSAMNRIIVYYEHLSQEKVAEQISRVMQACGYFVETYDVSPSDVLFELGQQAAAEEFDFVIVTLGGRESVSFFSGFRAAIDRNPTAPRPLTVSMTVGLVLDRAFYGTYSFRDGADVILVNRESDIEKLRGLFDSYGNSGPKILACRCPIFAEFGTGEAKYEDDPRKIVFAVQTDVPRNAAEREYITDCLLALAEADPRYEIIIKPKHRLTERSAHPQTFPYEHILLKKTIKRTYKNVRISYDNMAELIRKSDAVISVSSTAVIEALSFGKRAAAIADLGVRENLGNTYFLGSGLLTTFERLIADDWPRCNREWLKGELGARQLDEALSGLLGDVAEAKAGRLAPKVSIFNARSSRSLAPNRPRADSFRVGQTAGLTTEEAATVTELVSETSSLLEAGRSAYFQRDYQGAIAVASHALETTPTATQHMQLASNAYEKQHRLNDALKMIKRALAARPNDRSYLRDYYRISIKLWVAAAGEKIGIIAGVLARLRTIGKNS